MQAYSIDLRERVLADVDAGLGTEATARKYRVSASWVRKLKRQRRETGQIGPRVQRVSHTTKLDPYFDQLDQLVQQKPDATLAELQTQLKELGVSAGVSTVWRALRQLRLTFKKKSCMPPNSNDRMCRSVGGSGMSRRLGST